MNIVIIWLVFRWKYQHPTAFLGTIIDFNYLFDQCELRNIYKFD